MKPVVTMRAALADRDLFGNILVGESWAAWRTLLLAAMGEELTSEERTIFEGLTGREREPLELVAREANVSIDRLTGWRDRALAGAAAALKERERDDRDDEIARLKAKVGEITMDNELLYAKIDALENKRPLARRRLRK